MAKKKESTFVNLCVLAIICFVMIVGISAYVDHATGGPSQPKAVKRSGPSNAEIYVMAIDEVERRLKAPRTAKFCGYPNARVIEYELGKYTVTGWVDSQNSYGAMIRSNFEVSLEIILPNSWKLIHIEIN